MDRVVDNVADKADSKVLNAAGDDDEIVNGLPMKDRQHYEKLGYWSVDGAILMRQGDDPSITIQQFTDLLKTLSLEQADRLTDNHKFNPTYLRGLLSNLHYKYNNIEHALQEEKDETVSESLGALRNEIARLSLMLSNYLPFRVTDFLDKSGQAGKCQRCGERGHPCRGCRACWCDSDVNHRTHYLHCPWGDYVREWRHHNGINYL